MTELTPRQIKAAALLATGEQIGQVAEQIAVNEKTLWKWRQMPEFRADLNRRRDALVENFQDGLRGLVNRTTATLAGLLGDDDPNVRLKAARLLMDHLKPFAYEQNMLTGIGPTDPTGCAPKYLGTPIPPTREEQLTQLYLIELERFLLGEIASADLELLLDVEGIDDITAAELAADHDQLLNLVRTQLADSDKVESNVK